MNPEREAQDITWRNDKAENARHNLELRPIWQKKIRRPLTPVDRLWERVMIERLRSSTI